MKCLSLWQPWATLMAIGAKRIETRSWETMHRGPLAIHAAKKRNRELSEMCGTDPFASALSPAGMGTHDLPFGAIVCVLNVTACLRTIDLPSWIVKHTEGLSSEVRARYALSVNERDFGDYSPGRFAWLTSNVRKLATPIPFRGAQGLFDIQDNVVAISP